MGWHVEKVSLMAFTYTFTYTFTYSTKDSIQGIISYILTQIAGVDPVNLISVREFILAAAIVGEPAVDIVHPAGQLTAVELVKLVDSLHVG